MTKKLERVRKIRKKNFDKMVEQLLKIPPLKTKRRTTVSEAKMRRGNNWCKI